MKFINTINLNTEIAFFQNQHDTNIYDQSQLLLSVI